MDSDHFHRLKCGSHSEAAPLPCARHFLWGTFLDNLGMENLGIWRIQEFGEFRNLENLGIWRILGEIVEYAESKTRSEEGILRSLRTCVQKHVARSFLQSLFFLMAHRRKAPRQGGGADDAHP